MMRRHPSLLRADNSGAAVIELALVAFFYYARVVRTMWFDQPAEDATKVPIPAALMVAIGITTAIVVVVGVYPQFFAHIGELAFA
jgi:NADH:ubiquinone oxidoreductase subunit 2 (subunit N)